MVQRKAMSVNDELKAIDAKVDTLITDMATIKATLKTNAPIDKEKFELLFRSRETHADRIGSIERDYVRRTTHDELERRVGTLELNVSRHIGMLVAIVAALNFIGVGGIAALVYWGGGHR